MRNRLVAGVAAAVLAVGLGLFTAGTASAGTLGAVPAGHTSTAAGTLKPLDVCNYTSARPTLQQGSSGTAVKQLQCYLNLSLNDDFLTVDGSFGPATASAVREFQSCDGISVDGIVGPITWGDLNWWANSAYYCDAGDVG